ncbi:MAG: hypothetical protein K2X35_11500 [Bryobacteraceae bacterium]|nr:hypothetical protein [Bryobacteraceae bacterium]
MKLRLKDNTVRVRITQSELRGLINSGWIESRTDFAPGQSLSYRLLASQDDVVSAAMDAGAIRIEIPRARLLEWAAKSDLSLSAGNFWPGGSVQLLIEKDLGCAKPRPGEDPAEAFPAPPGHPVHCQS